MVAKSESNFEKGWLSRQMLRVERDFATWPEWMKRLAKKAETPQDRGPSEVEETKGEDA